MNGEKQKTDSIAIMIFRRTLSSLMGFIVIFASLYIIEAASFRLVESYAKFRLNLSWGDCLNSKFNPYLRKLPLDHFSEPITSGQSLNLSNI